MSALIYGLEIPQEGFVEVLIRDDGTVQQTGKSYRIDGTDYYTPYVGEMPVIYKAVPVPPHGRLIDADALKETFRIGMENATPLFTSGLFLSLAEYVTKALMEDIDEAPTLIEADWAEEGE